MEADGVRPTSHPRRRHTESGEFPQPLRYLRLGLAPDAVPTLGRKALARRWPGGSRKCHAVAVPNVRGFRFWTAGHGKRTMLGYTILTQTSE